MRTACLFTAFTFYFLNAGVVVGASLPGEEFDTENQGAVAEAERKNQEAALPKDVLQAPLGEILRAMPSQPEAYHPLRIRSYTGDNLLVNVNVNWTVSYLKGIIRKLTGTSAEKQKLTLPDGRFIKNDSTLKDFIPEHSVVIL